MPARNNFRDDRSFRSLVYEARKEDIPKNGVLLEYVNNAGGSFGYSELKFEKMIVLEEDIVWKHIWFIGIDGNTYDIGRVDAGVLEDAIGKFGLMKHDD